MSGYWEIEAAVSPARILVDGSAQLLVRVQISISTTPTRRLPRSSICAPRRPGGSRWRSWPPPMTPTGRPSRAAARRRHDERPDPRNTGGGSHARASDRRPARRPVRGRPGDRRRAGRRPPPARRANDRLRPIPSWIRSASTGRSIVLFCAYQQASEQRRQLAVDVGELSQQLTERSHRRLHHQQARSTNVHELAAGSWQPTEEEKENKR